MLPRMTQPKNTYTVDYPSAIEFRDKQLDTFWTHKEIDIGKDVQDIRVNLNETEREAILLTLKLFSHYEMFVDDFWVNHVANEFPRPEIVSMATLFGAVESSIHLPFYSKINEELGCHTDEFYRSYEIDPVLSERMEYIGSLLQEEDLAYRLGAFAFVEGAVLFSAFAFLKSFQSNGRNLMPNLGAGLSFSIRDETLHSEAAGWLFQQYMSEYTSNPELLKHYEALFQEVAHHVLETETLIVQKLFANGHIEGISEKQLVAFVKHRINQVMKNLGFEGIYKVDYNPIQAWFYDSVSGYSMHDFFQISGNQYSRSWDSQSFTW